MNCLSIIEYTNDSKLWNWMHETASTYMFSWKKVCTMKTKVFPRHSRFSKPHINTILLCKFWYFFVWYIGSNAAIWNSFRQNTVHPNCSNFYSLESTIWQIATNVVQKVEKEIRKLSNCTFYLARKMHFDSHTIRWFFTR